MPLFFLHSFSEREKTMQKSFLRAAVILAAAALICKAMGVVYRILLGNLIGTEAMGSYQTAFSVYTLALSICTGGISTTLSLLVAKYHARRQNNRAKGYFKTAMYFVLAAGASITLLLLCFCPLICRVMGAKAAEGALFVASLSVVPVALASALRGYYQGMRNMFPTALSQVVEQAIKMTAGLFFAGLLLKKGESHAAMGAMIGVSASEIGAFLVLLLFKRPGRAEKPNKEKLTELLKIALPQTIGMAAIPVMNSVDSAIVMNVLMKTGYTASKAASLFGLYSGFVLPLVSLPALLSSAVSMSLVPSLAAACANDRKGLQKRLAELGIKCGMLIGIPCAVIFFFLGQPLLDFLYRGLNAAEVSTAAELVRLMAPGALFLCLCQTLGGVLQGFSRAEVSVVNLLLGAAVKLALGWSLMMVPGLGIKGAAISTSLCYMLTAALNGMGSIKYSSCSFTFGDFIVKPLAAGGFMAAALYAFLQCFAGMRNAPKLFISVFLSLLVYAVSARLLRLLSKNDIRGLSLYAE